MTTLAHQDQLQAVREAVIKANPTEVWCACLAQHKRRIGWQCSCGCHQGRAVERPSRPIRLADILLGLGKIAVLPDDFLVLSNGRIVADNRKISRVWDLHADALDQQSEETVSYLHGLLCR